MRKQTKIVLSMMIVSMMLTGQVSAYANHSSVEAGTNISMQRVKNTPKAAVNPYEVAGIDDPAALHKYIGKLQQAVAKNNRKAVAALMSYPLQVNKQGKSKLIQSKKQFMKNYDHIMTSQVKKKLLAQQLDQLFVNSEGVMIGDGEMWISQFGKTIAVYAMNV
ncbi:hypothetical protein BVG16_22035 [Paenibacillus selenitireducens]|uniref:Uncharacterized protein n=1 Tax=Paenibacillus selenitireducens TaxID=1324314 RepID=A0A1T2X5W2_9BACL|nr:hypothetical protein [Paenibacillus selenitireducens]OPA75279.1 hypothetical protein BVG16_22035 [Paenibacillus selenitireducens]